MTLIEPTPLERGMEKAKKYIRTHIKEYCHLSKQSRDKARQDIHDQELSNRAEKEAAEMELSKKRKQKSQRRAYYQSLKRLSERTTAVPVAESKKQQPMRSPSQFVGRGFDQPEASHSVVANDKRPIIFASADHLEHSSSHATHRTYGPLTERELSHASKSGLVSPSRSIIIAAKVNENVQGNGVSPQSSEMSR